MRGWCFILTLSLASAAWADLVHLRDGTTLSGAVKRVGATWVVTDPSGKVTTIPDEQVQGVEKVGNINPEEAGESRLLSLRRSTENLSDIKQIIDRYQKFVEQNSKTRAGQEAAKELAVWQERLDKGLIKVGPRWVTPEEQTSILAKQVGQVDQVRALMRESRMREADAIITQLLIDDPTNISALYLQGVSLFKQEKWPAARKAFDQVRAALPDHAPTLNNLGVLLFRQHQVPGAMTFYNQAMLAAPENKLILGNVAEALNATSKEDHDATPVTKASKTFTEQDTNLQARLNAQGLFRWGSTWVNKDQMAELKKVEAAIQEKLDALSKEYDGIKEKIGDIELTMTANERAIDRINAERTGIDQYGRLVVLPPPDSFYRIQRRQRSSARPPASPSQATGRIQRPRQSHRTIPPCPQILGPPANHRRRRHTPGRAVSASPRHPPSPRADPK